MEFAGWAARSRAAMESCARSFGAVALFMVALGGVAQAQVSVGDGGTPSFSQAIAVPPGVAGMSPKLGLFYAGGGVNGPLGHGWSVQGLSSITRCAATLAVDGKRAGVTYGPNDKLCLDGQRLIQTDANGAVAAFPQSGDAAGLGAGATREYRTEKDIYARVRAYGYANGDTSGASGPAYFRVWTKAGQIYDYGASPVADANTKALIAPPSKPPIAWATARISDTLGNFIDFKYEQRDLGWGSGPNAGSPTLGHEWNVLEIQYSGNKVLFNYDLDGSSNDVRPDKAEAYQLGSKNVSVRRLKSITTYVNSPPSAMGVNGGTAVRTTTLTYEQGAISGRSRVKKIQDCAGGPGSTRCLPATTLNYADGGSDAYQASSGFAGSSLASMDLLGSTGTTGILLGDFNGDGKTDILYWSDTPANNKLYTSNGDGGFTLNSGFNVTDLNLFKSDGCYYSIAADFNGDGITDILRIMRPTTTVGNTSCGTQTNVLLLGSGNGGFSRVTLPAGIDFTQKASRVTDMYNCIQPFSNNYLPNCSEPGDTYLGTLQTAGANFHLLDVNGDGILDIVTTIVPGARTTSAGLPPESVQCASITCTHVYLGSSTGVFTELTTTNLTNHSLYADPPSRYDFWRKPYVLDANGDGLSDLLVNTGLWTSNGDGNFSFVTSSTFTVGCANAIDFNGDGRADCLNATAGYAAGQTLTIGDGTYALNATANFNLKSAGQELLDIAPSTFTLSVGTQIADFNGDGRQDILRWKDDASQNVLYLSNGDGSFTASTTFNLAGTQLQKSDGTSSLLLGDFTGRGAAELLRLQTVGSTVSNVLYTKVDSTPADQLVSVVGPTGLTTTLYYVPLTNSTPSNGVSDATLGARYVSDQGNASYAVASAVDLTLPLYVVATSVSDSGVGSAKIATEMSYRGFKADTNGRGSLGFREVLRQRPGANGSSSADNTPLTVDTQYVQVHPYIGVAANTATYVGKLNVTGSALQLSSTTNVYCDQTNAAAASSTVNCPVTAKVARPYLYQSTETGKDLGGVALPQVVTVNTFNGSGDPTQIGVTTTGTAAGIAQTFSKSVSNTYQADNTACSDVATCSWVMGRLSQASVTNTVPNSIASFTSSAGNSAYATATSGSGPLLAALLTPTSYDFGNVAGGSAVTKDFVLANDGANTLSLTVPSAASLSGTDFSLASTTCGASLAAASSCVVTVRFAPTVPGSRSGALTISSGAGNFTATLAGNGQMAALSFSAAGGTVLNWGTQQVGGTYGSTTITLTNSGNVTASSVAINVSSGWSIASSNCSTSLGASASCTFSLNWSPTTAQAYSGQVTVSATGVSGSNVVTLQGTATNPSLAKTTADNFSFNVPISTGSGHPIFVQNNGAGPVTINNLTYSASSGNFNAWMAASGSGNPNGGYCWPGVVLQPGWSCGGWANADTGAGTATFNTTAGAITFTGSFTAKALSYGSATGASVAATSGQTATLYAMAINNSTPFTYYFPRYGAGGGLATLGRFTGTNAGNFVVTGSSCGANLAPNSSCTVNIAATGISTSNTTYSANFQPNGTYQQSGDGGNGSWAGVPNWLVNMGTSLADVFVSAVNPVNVTTPPLPTVTAASFSPTSVTAGASSTFSWTTANASSATVSCSGAGTTASGSGTSGSISVPTTAAGTATCTVSASGAGGSGSGQASLSVVAAPTVSGVAFSSGTPDTSSAVTLSWTPGGGTTNVTVSCSGTGYGSGGGTGITGSSTIITSSATTGAATCTVTPYNSLGAAGTAGSASYTSALGTFSYIGVSHSSMGNSGDIATFTIQNVGSGNLKSISIGCPFGSFHAVGGWPTSLAPNATGQFQCQAAASGSYGGVLSISANNATNSPFTAPPSAPTASVTGLSFSASTVTTGATPTLSWTTSNATSVAVSCSGAASGSYSGTQVNSSLGIGTSTTGIGTCTVTPYNSVGTAGSGSSVNVSVVAAPSVGSVSFSPTSVTAGGSSTLSWSTSNASTVNVSCASPASGGGSGVSANGSMPIGSSAAGTGTCTVTAINAAGTAVSGSANLTVNAPPVPTASSSFNVGTITTGGAATFSWSASNATSTSASCSGAVTGSGSGSATAGSITATAGGSAGTGICTVTATGAGGTTTSQANVNVVLPPSVSGASFSPTSVTAGGSSTFSWSTSNATSASVSCSGAGATATGSGTSGSISVGTTTSGTASCSVTAVNAAGSSASGSASLTVNAGSSVVFTASGPSSSTWTFTNPNSTAQTVTALGLQFGASGNTMAAAISGGTCGVGGSVAAGSSCTVVVSAPSSDCKPDNYSVAPALTTAAGTVTGAWLSRNSNNSTCL